jgi:hypothetical protein
MFRSPNGNPRGLLSKLLQCFPSNPLPISILLAGTYWTLGLAENVESDMGDKYGTLPEPVTMFKLHDCPDLVNYFENRLNLDECGDIR